MDFDSVWQKIIMSENNNFKTVTGKVFSYTISGTLLHPVVKDKEIRNISKNNIEKAFLEWPVSKPSGFSSSIQGTSYLFALFADKRIME